MIRNETAVDQSGKVEGCGGWRRLFILCGAPWTRPLFFLALITIAVLSLLPRDYRPHTAYSGHAEHFVAYAASGFLLAFAYASLGARMLGCLCLALASGLFELLQNLSPGRTPSVEDALASSSGAAFGAVLGSVAFALIATRLVAQDLRGLN